MTKNNIFHVALQIIADNGVEGLSMRKIATKINCTPSSLYNHFRDKDELLNELFWDSYLKLEISDSSVDIRVFLMNLFTNALNNKNELFFVKKNHNSTFISDETRKKLIYDQKRKIEHLEKILEYNKIKKKDVKNIHLIIIGTAIELVQQEKINKKDLEIIVNLICNGIIQEEQRENIC